MFTTLLQNENELLSGLALPSDIVMTASERTVWLLHQAAMDNTIIISSMDFGRHKRNWCELRYLLLCCWHVFGTTT
ncbi:hypothetical protein Pcinc_004656 [Petrolisthes cinctipes]|uniref:Uncharacterized protein n=1 Tax=Petrolisthes cinctipes TaxID=88211 RepID=A0AAE1GKZ5_PETCI|nr:hypothetical protein Pcinc_004656 [Petrolisthes cinctipes]